MQNATLKTEPTILFGTKKSDDKILIAQDVSNINLISRMAGYSKIERAAMMGLQTLVGLARFKEILKDSPFEVDENGQKIYSQKFSTITHTVNLQNLKYLEDLGYVKIDSMTEKIEGKTLSERLATLNSKNGVSKSYILFEKLGFGNLKGAKDAVRAMLSHDEKFKDDNRVIMQQATFRLTDKPLDFGEIQSFTNPQTRNNLPKEKKQAARHLGMMVRQMMKGRKIQIEKDAFGRPYIKYPSRVENAKINAEKKKNRIEKERRAKANEATKKYNKGKDAFEDRIQATIEQTQGEIGREEAPITQEVSKSTTNLATQKKVEEDSLDL